MPLVRKLVLVTVALGYVTFYNPVGKNLSCMRPLGKPKGQWKWDGKLDGVAHRWLPCGSEVYVRVGGSIVKTTVVDRGPFGALNTQGTRVVASPKYLAKWWKQELAKEGKEATPGELDRLSRELPPGWKWLSTVDILASLKARLGTKGGRQPGELLVEEAAWGAVKEKRPGNDVFVEPPPPKKAKKEEKEEEKEEEGEGSP